MINEIAALSANNSTISNKRGLSHLLHVVPRSKSISSSPKLGNQTDHVDRYAEVVLLGTASGAYGRAKNTGGPLDHTQEPGRCRETRMKIRDRFVPHTLPPAHTSLQTSLLSIQVVGWINHRGAFKAGTTCFSHAGGCVHCLSGKM